MKSRVQYGEREIDLLHFICYLLEKNKSLVVVFSASILVILGFINIKEMEIYEPLDEIKQKMEIAYEYRQMYEMQKEYNDNSIIMQLDSNNVYEGCISYYIANKGDESELSSSYSVIVEDEIFLEKVAVIACSEPRYIREVIGVDYVRSSFSEETNIAAGVITYYVTHFEKEVCRKILECIMEQVEICHQQNREKYGDCVFRKITDDLIIATSNEYLDKRYDCIDKLERFNHIVVSAEDSFTGRDLVYYQTNYLNENINLEESKKIVLKYSVVGVVGSVLLWVAFWGVRYLFDNTIYTKEEVEKRYGIPVIGHIRIDEKKNSLYSKWKKYTYDTKDYMEYILNTLSDNGIVICGFEGFENDEKDVFCYAKYLWEDSKILEKAKRRGNIVIGINLNKSTYGEIEKEIEMCMIQNINIIGIIVWE